MHVSLSKTELVLEIMVALGLRNPRQPSSQPCKQQLELD